MRVLIATVLVVLSSMPASVFAAGNAERRNPYASLFTAQLDGGLARRSAPAQSVGFDLPRAQSAIGPTVVCGMTVRNGDSHIDPALVHHPRANSPKPSITIMPAPACQHSQL